MYPLRAPPGTHLPHSPAAWVLPWSLMALSADALCPLCLSFVWHMQGMSAEVSTHPEGVCLTEGTWYSDSAALAMNYYRQIFDLGKVGLF